MVLVLITGLPREEENDFGVLQSLQGQHRDSLNLFPDALGQSRIRSLAPPAGTPDEVRKRRKIGVTLSF